MRLQTKQKCYLEAMGIDVWRTRETRSKQPIQCVVMTAERWLWVLGGYAPSQQELALLQKMNQALHLSLGDWQEVTVTELQASSVAAIVCLGVIPCQGFLSLLPEDPVVGSMQAWPQGGYLLVTQSLTQMIQQPNCKRDVWRDLQALQAKVVKGG